MLKIDCEGCEWDAFADIARRSPMLLASVRHLLLELHLTPRYGLRSASQLNHLMEHLVTHHGFRLFRRPRKNRGFPWARNETLPALRRAGLDPVACCTELHFSRPNHTATFLSHADWLVRMEPKYESALAKHSVQTRDVAPGSLLPSQAQALLHGSHTSTKRKRTHTARSAARRGVQARGTDS